MSLTHNGHRLVPLPMSPRACSLLRHLHEMFHAIVLHLPLLLVVAMIASLSLSRLLLRQSYVIHSFRTDVQMILIWPLTPLRLEIGLTG